MLLFNQLLKLAPRVEFLPRLFGSYYELLIVSHRVLGAGKNQVILALILLLIQLSLLTLLYAHLFLFFDGGSRLPFYGPFLELYLLLLLVLDLLR
jgi:hypothetical protein